MDILVKEGPLAQVWLAANVEKKLSKHQFLQSNIVASTQAIVQTTPAEPLALRLSGQLLYGIVRIYSRKAKYLLDDVSEALLRLKSLFKTSNTVTAPEHTVVSNVANLILPDAVTERDLFWQEPLDLDDGRTVTGAVQQQNFGEEEFDTSIEVARRFDDELDDFGGDIELDFDLGESTKLSESTDVRDMEDGGFDLDFDQSIEVARRVDVDDAALEQTFDLDLQLDKEPHEEEEEIVVRPPKRRRQNSILKDTRPLVVDENVELNVNTFEDSSAIIKDPEVADKASDQSKDLEFLPPFINEEFFRGVKRTREEPEDITLGLDDLMDDGGFPDGAFEDGGFEGDTYGGTEELEPDLHDDAMVMESMEEEELNNTGVIEAQLRETFESNEETTFSEALKANAESDERLHSEPKRQACRVFFEMLVLGTKDSVELEQRELFGEITIKPKQALLI